MNKFHIVGAFDRHNYGDILFPLIHSHLIMTEFGKSAEVNFYSITKADLTSIGGVKTQSIKSLIAQNPCETEVVVMCGGDILAVDWPSMIGNLYSPAVNLALINLRKVVRFKLANLLVKLFFKQKNEFPYVCSKKNLKCKVYYTCVGGGGFVAGNDKYHLDRVADELKQVDWVSVRDFRTQELLIAKGVVAKLVPDSALIMSDIYSTEFLSSRNWSGKIRASNSFSYDNYIVFQGGKTYLGGGETEISRQLLEISERAGFSVLLLPIGRATGHEDHVVLEAIFARLVSLGAPCAIQDSPHVFDIMASLAFSKSYIGTSLHGAITSYSYGNKICGIMTSDIDKLKNFALTWLSECDYSLVPNLDFATPFLELIDRGSSIEGASGLLAQKESVHQELSRYHFL